MGTEELMTQIVATVASNVVKSNSCLWINDRVLDQDHCGLIIGFCIPDPKYSSVVLQMEYLSRWNMIFCYRINKKRVRQHVLVEHAFEGPFRVLASNTC